MKKILILLLPFFILTGCKQQELTPAQRMKRAHEQAENIEKIKLPDFTFYPNSVTPQFRTEIQLTRGVSFMSVTQKSVSAELPYLGHFYIRPLSRMDIPVRFNSTEFVYTVKYDRERDAYSITILPEDVYGTMNRNMVITMLMDKDGTGRLTIKTDNRDEISYRGYYR